MWMTMVLLGCQSAPVGKPAPGAPPTTSQPEAPPTSAEGPTSEPPGPSTDGCEPLRSDEWLDTEVVVNGESRPTWVYVPEGAACDAPLWVDLHLTPTEPYAEGMEIYGPSLFRRRELADATGAILVRPRGEVGATEYGYDGPRWGATPERDALAIDAIVAQLGFEGHPRWLLAEREGTTVGQHLIANGTDWAGLALLDPVFAPVDLAAAGVPAPRIYLYGSTRTGLAHVTALDQALADAGHPAADRWRELGVTSLLDPLDWVRPRAAAFLADAVPPPSTAPTGWVESPFAPVTLLAIDHDASALRAAGEDGAIYEDGAVTPVAAGPVLGLCGDLALTSQGLLDHTTGEVVVATFFASGLACDGERVAVADLQGPIFLEADGSLVPDRGYAHTVALRGATSVVAGLETHSVYDGTQLAHEALLVAAPDQESYGLALSDSTALAVTRDGGIFRAEPPFERFERVHPAGGLPLHAVHLEGVRAVAVGHGGQALVSDDEGRSWTALPLPRDVALFDVRLDGDTIEAVGDQGARFRHPWPL